VSNRTGMAWAVSVAGVMANLYSIFSELTGSG
jgi:hypothetical protein